MSAAPIDVERLHCLIDDYFQTALFRDGILPGVIARTKLVKFFIFHDAALRERIDELEAQLFIAQAEPALPLFEVMHLEPCAFPSIRSA